MKSDNDIRRDVENELRWDPDIDATDITVSVKDGVVALNGYVPSYSQKYEAERDSERVQGVKGLANDIEVRLRSVDQRPDPDIARDAVSAIETQLPFWKDHIKVTVRDGWITLTGEAEWHFQHERAETAVRHIRGAKGVLNQITMKPRVSAMDVKTGIEEALKRSATVDASHVTVEANGGTVTLRGQVRSWAERQEAERAAWRAPGVTMVNDQVSVGT
ncbi:BON domain-containing protein [Microvirga sp. M2]|uniref:BON domain-containing protein n=1 Tax=Microvirga sp. M2 TaxID=3073270 RepID=UPI0039C3D0FA